jgi:hypothetical protein
MIVSSIVLAYYLYKKKLNYLYKKKLNYVYNLNMINNNIKDIVNAGFKFQWSHDKRSGYTDINPNPNYFAITDKGLKFNIYKDDKTFSLKSDTFPRTELRGTIPILDNIDYTLSYDYLIDIYPSGYDFCWTQIFGGDNANIMLRFRSGQYKVVYDMKNRINKVMNINLIDDLYKWVSWKMDFKLSSSGYIKVYHNNSIVIDLQNIDTSGGNNNSYLKMGIYSQQMNPPSQMSAFLKNLKLIKN